jgi:hypothetical protein
VLAWRYPSGQGFDRAAAAAIKNHLRQAALEPPRIPPERRSREVVDRCRPIDE